MTTPISKKRKFVADGVFKAELNELLTRELAEDGYSGVEVRVTPSRTEIIIMATRTQNVLGTKGRRIRDLTSVVQKRFNFPENTVELYAEKVATRGLCAIAQAESLRYKLIGGLAVRRACYGVLRFIMESGAKGCEVVVSGKLRGQRAKSMKFVDGLMIHSGEPTNDFVDSATRHVLLRQGVLGIKVKIMLKSDSTGKTGPKKPLPDNVLIVEPKEETLPTAPSSELKPSRIETTGLPVAAVAKHYSSFPGIFLGVIKVNLPLKSAEAETPSKNVLYVKVQGTDDHALPAFIEYEKPDSSTVDLTYTYVPPLLRRLGIGKELTRLALNHFKNEDVKIKLTCYYLQKQYQANFSNDPQLSKKVIFG